MRSDSNATSLKRPPRWQNVTAESNQTASYKDSNTPIKPLKTGKVHDGGDRKHKAAGRKGVDDEVRGVEGRSSDCMSREAAPVETRHEQSSRERHDAQRRTPNRDNRQTREPVRLFRIREFHLSVCILSVFVLRQQHLGVPSLKKSEFLLL